MATDRPNVALIVLDTARSDDVFGTKSLRAVTPSLADIAADGTRYDRVVVPAPWTLPSHASLFTGTYPSKHGAHADHKRLDDRLLVLAEAFSGAGYETVAVSNNTWISEEFGFRRGFETFRKTWQYVQSETDLGRIARTEEGLDKLRQLAAALFDGNPAVNLANAVYGQFFRKQTDSGARRTNEWIDDWLATRDESRPFFLFVNYLEPHLPYRPPRKYAERYLPTGVSFDDAMAVPQDAWGYIAGDVDLDEKDFEVLRALYRAEIAYLDHRIGELRNSLEAAGAWDDTIFVVTGDHGENIGDHGLMDHQYCLYDTLIHVPLIVHGGVFTGGETVDDLVQLTDVGPTLLDAAGIDDENFHAQAQGRSFHPASDAEPRAHVIGEYLAPQPSMEALQKRVGDLPEDIYEYDRALRAIRDENWKLIRGSDGSIELYDVREDPGETTDLSDAHPSVVERLSDDLDAWLQSFDHADTDDDVDIQSKTRDRLEDLGYLQ